MENLTKSERFIIEFLSGKGFTNPSTIGYAWGESNPSLKGNYHSSWASPKCKKLVSLGILVRNDKGHYKLGGNS